MKKTIKVKTKSATEFMVKIRIKPERLEWFSQLSDRIGLTRDQTVSAMLESNMEADSNGFGIEEAQYFIVQAAAEIFPEREALRVLAEAYEAEETATNKMRKATGEALIDLFKVAPKEMGFAAFAQAENAVRMKAMRL